jgi:hypothetical protein
MHCQRHFQPVFKKIKAILLPLDEAKLRGPVMSSCTGRAGGWKQKWATGPRVIKFGTQVHPDALLNVTWNGVSSYFRSAARPPSWLFTLRHRFPKWFYRTSPNLVGLTYIHSDILPRNKDVVNYFLGSSRHFEKIFFCRKWTTSPRVTKFGKDVHPSTVIHFAENDVTSYVDSNPPCYIPQNCKFTVTFYRVSLTVIGSWCQSPLAYCC